MAEPNSRQTESDNGGESNVSRRRTIDRRDPDRQLQVSNDQRRPNSDRRGSDAKPESPALTREEREERFEMRLQMHRKKKLLAGCEPVMNLNYELLALDNYPSNDEIAAARKDQNLWTSLFCVFISIFLVGLFGILPAAVTATCFGLSLVALAAKTAYFGSLFSDVRPLSELQMLRKTMEFQALSHIRYLEGLYGMAWRCSKMAKYNSNLNRKLFEGLIEVSENRAVLDVIRTKKQIRLYLLYMIEAQKAYKRLQRDYLENHFKHLDDGWDDALTEEEIKQLPEEDR